MWSCFLAQTSRITITLPALQKDFVNIFFVFAWEFALKNGGDFWCFFLVSVPHETKHENSSKNSGKIRSEIRGKIQDKNSKNLENFRSATFLTSRVTMQSTQRSPAGNSEARCPRAGSGQRQWVVKTLGTDGVGGVVTTSALSSNVSLLPIFQGRANHEVQTVN